jgi:hypothetical protein
VKADDTKSDFVRCPKFETVYIWKSRDGTYGLKMHIDRLMQYKNTFEEQQWCCGSRSVRNGIGKHTETGGKVMAASGNGSDFPFLCQTQLPTQVHYVARAGLTHWGGGRLCTVDAGALPALLFSPFLSPFPPLHCYGKWWKIPLKMVVKNQHPKRGIFHFPGRVEKFHPVMGV